MAVVKVIDSGSGKGKQGQQYAQLALHIVVGKLMGYDPLLNLVLDETVEYLKGKHKMAVCA